MVQNYFRQNRFFREIAIFNH